MSVCTSCGHENREAARFCDACGAPVAVVAPAREQRKTVTVLFCDVTGSTALGERLDPEALRVLLARYFERMSAIVCSHGGTVEKFIGDAVMAVFGVPQLHEDDALRAVRAAVEMRDALPELGIEGRIGVATGEVVTGTKERLATGDAVNVAARLEQAAQPGEVLIGSETLALVRTAVSVEPVEPLTLKGKAQPVPAFRVLEVIGELQRSNGTRMVGREDELRLLDQAWERSSAERAPQLFTVFGTAGVGKSRLAAEFLDSLGDARIVRGRCVAYGVGITYWPVVEILKQLDVLPPDRTAATVIASLLGETQAETTPTQIAWAFRKTLEHAADERPLVCVLDDLHWAEPPLLDLVEHVAVASRDAPILLFCMARPELLDRRPGWAGGLLNATSVLLEPLSPGHTDELIESLLAGADLAESLKRRIVDAAEGNPLFVEELLAMVRDSPGGKVTIPPTIQALLAARLDQLDPVERSLLERGAVEGKVFHRSAVEALAPGAGPATEQLLTLVRKELLRPERALLPDDDAFRFRHLLIRDAAYDGLPKSVRAELHQRFAAWLGEHGDELVELDEVIGYHLEQACRYRAELGQPADPELAGEARRRLSAAARRALFRNDFGAAANLLDRAGELVPPDELDIELGLERVGARLFAQGPERAVELATELVERAERLGDRSSVLMALLERELTRLYFVPGARADNVEALLDEALPLFEASGDDFALFTGYFALARLCHVRARMDAALAAAERALVHARRSQAPHRELNLVPLLRSGRSFGTTSVTDALTWLDEFDAAAPQHPAIRSYRAVSLAMLGRFDEARAVASTILAELDDQGAAVPYALMTGHLSSEIERLAGDLEAAAEFALDGCRRFRALGERAWLSTAAGFAGQALYGLGRLDEAEELAREARETGGEDDTVTQMLWRQVEAKVRARRGDLLEAERLAREAVALGDETDMIDAQGETLHDLGVVLSLAGKPADAAEAFQRAAERFERKGNIVSRDRVRALLAELRPVPAPDAG